MTINTRHLEKLKMRLVLLDVLFGMCAGGSFITGMMMLLKIREASTLRK